MRQSLASGTQQTEQLDQVIVRFAGDSGDGMQLTGDRFTTSSAHFGNDMATFPDFPAEIRAPAGTLNGVSAFQVHISDHDILTPGDAPNVLVAMNPAALKANLELMAKGTILLVNSDAFEERNLTKAGYAENPLSDGSLGAYTVYEVPMTSITQEVCKEAGVKPRDAERSKNFFALGLVSWLYTRPIDPTLEWITERFGSKPQVAEANRRAFRAGFDFGETAELFESNYEVRPATFEPGEYVQVTGNSALAWGLITASRLAGLPLFLGSYPITPASDILHELSRRKEFGIRTFQAEDEIAGIGAALGAAFGGSLGVTTTSGPGLDLKSETIGLAINLELPLLIVDVQRGGPSTGLPTKTEQADLLHAMYGRHGEAPLPIIAPQNPSDCFAVAIEATRLAVKYRTPVIVLSDGYLANGAEPWRLPDVDTLEPIDPDFASEPNHIDDDGTASFWPYIRDPETLARPWAPPGLPGLEHRIGGLEKADGSGNVDYEGVNHELMVHLRRNKIAGIAADIPLLEVNDETGDAQLLLVSWGSTYAAVAAGVKRVRARGMKVAHAHLRYLNPFPSNLGEVLDRYTQVLVPEINLGQLSRILRADFLVDAQSYNKVQGVPFRVGEIEAAIVALLGGM
ncbi:MAG TPA: 2-oxoacid:acceptor oxidoreductase subunit alpha [Acidimicrobiales bacterium]|jgi:2-oxoglutarate ferredoxin oxidoreductase subunit alpha|nr:2-oxoacid:acceptor oxidoreductase subunit alpha [Acidimicrobiales bacterium]